MEESDDARLQPPPRTYTNPARKSRCSADTVGYVAALIVAVGCWFGDQRLLLTPTWTVHLNATSDAPILTQRIMVPVTRVAPTMLMISILLLFLAKKIGGNTAVVLRRVESVASTAVITALLGVLAGCIDFWLLMGLFQLGATMATALILQDIFCEFARIHVELFPHTLALFAWLGSWIVILDHVRHTRVPKRIRGALGVYFVLSICPFIVVWIRSMRGMSQERQDTLRDAISIGSRAVLVIMLTAGLQAVSHGILV